MTQDKYFVEDLTVDGLMDKVENYFNDLEQLGFLTKIQRSYNQYYGHGYEAVTHSTTPNGSQGELTSVSINTYRSLLRHQFTLITSERPAYNTRPINTDYKSMAQAIVGDDVLEYYLTQRHLEDRLKEATEKALVTSEGFVGLSWNAEAGDFYAKNPETDKPVMTGDIEYRTYTTLEVARDVRKDGEQDWMVLISYENKYEVAAAFPEYEHHIMNLDVMGVDNRWRNWFRSNNGETDVIPFFTFYHRKCQAVPEGKYAYFVEGQLLADGPIPYPEIPVYRITPAELYNSCLGYTQGFDILGAQEVTDSLYEAVISNNINFSRQCVQAPKDADISVSQITNGMSLLEYDGDKPIQPLQLVASAPETYKLIETLERHMESFTGINEVVRGDPSANVRSGNSMALLAAQAIKFNSDLQHSYARMLEKVGTATLLFLQEFAEAPRFMTVVGKNNRTYLKEFNKESIGNVSRIEVKIASALSKTTAGKVEIANNLLQQGLIKRPEQYIMVLETGKLDPMVESEESEMMNIKAENEVLRDGGEVVVIAIDDHPLHIKEHKAVINDPEARKEPSVVAATLKHIQEHIEQWQTQDPNILMSLGIQPIQPAMPPQGQAGGQAPQGGDGVPVDSLEAEQAVGDLPNMPNLPSMPEGTPEADQQALEEMNLEQPN